MTAHRRPEIRFSDADRGTCRWCGEAIVYGDGPKQGTPDRRRRWHPDCVEDYNRSDPREARRRVRKRDRGICAACGIDTRALEKAHRGRGAAKALRALGFVPRRSLWELDHVVPLIDGGGHDLANLQTLCTPCHRSKTAAEARDRAMRQRPIADLAPASAIASTDDVAADARRPEQTLHAATQDGNGLAEPPSERPVPEDGALKRMRRSRRKATREEPLSEILERATRLNARVESMLREHPPGS